MQSSVEMFTTRGLFEAQTRDVGEARASGFFDAQGTLCSANLAAAVVLAVHRGLVTTTERDYLPLRVSG
jgi:hypothetical protein